MRSGAAAWREPGSGDQRPPPWGGEGEGGPRCRAAAQSRRPPAAGSDRQGEAGGRSGWVTRSRPRHSPPPPSRWWWHPKPPNDDAAAAAVAAAAAAGGGGPVVAQRARGRRRRLVGWRGGRWVGGVVESTRGEVAGSEGEVPGESVGGGSAGVAVCGGGACTAEVVGFSVAERAGRGPTTARTVRGEAGRGRGRARGTPGPHSRCPRCKAPADGARVGAWASLLCWHYARGFLGGGWRSGPPRSGPAAGGAGGGGVSRGMVPATTGV